MRFAIAMGMRVVLTPLAWVGVWLVVAGPLKQARAASDTPTGTNGQPQRSQSATDSLEMPSPFLNSQGAVITTASEWENRRGFLKEMLQDYVYGARPAFRIARVVAEQENPDPLVSANALTQQVRIYYDSNRYFTIRITRPAEKGNYPVMMRYESNEHFRFPIEQECIENRRYVIVALNQLSVAPENGDIPVSQMHEAKVIMAWAYAASLTVDYLETLDYVDQSKIAIAGMSRTAKAAICAAVYDQRFGMVAANSSGAAGASGLRTFGEKNTQAIGIVKHQPTWVSAKLLDYVDRATALPLDMHFARALIAPRVILSTEAYDGPDAKWAGLVSTFRMWEAADYAFGLYGKTANNLIHLRRGGHDQLPEDYDRMMEVINQVFYHDACEVSAYRKKLHDYHVDQEQDNL